MPPPASRERLLLVEDEESQRIFLGALAGSVCTVVTAANASDALEVLATSHVDVVLSDHELGGGLTGAQLLDEVAKRWPQVRRCLMSASHRQTDHRFIAKPIRMDELRSILHG